MQTAATWRRLKSPLYIVTLHVDILRALTFVHVYRSGQGQKRPTTVSKETYYSVKRDLLLTFVHVYRSGQRRGQALTKVRDKKILKSQSLEYISSISRRLFRNSQCLEYIYCIYIYIYMSIPTVYIYIYKVLSISTVYIYIYI